MMEVNILLRESKNTTLNYLLLEASGKDMAKSLLHVV
jgi:hypothetical protein